MLYEESLTALNALMNSPLQLPENRTEIAASKGSIAALSRKPCISSEETVVAISSRNQFQDSVPAFAWWDRGKPR
jgi:hypothetical protein